MRHQSGGIRTKDIEENVVCVCVYAVAVHGYNMRKFVCENVERVHFVEDTRSVAQTTKLMDIFIGLRGRMLVLN